MKKLTGKMSNYKLYMQNNYWNAHNFITDTKRGTMLIFGNKHIVGPSMECVL